VHQIHFRTGLRPGPRWGAYSAPPDPLAGLRGLLVRGEEGGRRKKREGERGRGRKGRGKGRGGRKRRGGER